MSRWEEGQAAVEFVGALPAVLLIAVVLCQLLAVGYAGVLAGNAAEAGALGLADGADAAASARHALPGWTRARAQVKVSGGRVTVVVRPPALLPAIGRALEISSTAAVAR